MDRSPRGTGTSSLTAWAVSKKLISPGEEYIAEGPLGTFFSPICWDGDPLVRRIVRRVPNVSHGKRDLRQVFASAEFVPGGTIGPARNR